MPYDRPTLTTLRNQARADVATNVTGGKQLPRFSVLGTLADEEAGFSVEQYGYLDWIAKQAVPFTATGEYLEGWAGLKGITREAATQAKCPTVVFSAVNGTLLPAGTLVVNPFGVEYTTDADATAASNIVTASVTAVADPLGLAGAFGNAASGTTMTLAASIGGIQSTGAATAAITGGSDLETDDQLRTRMLEKYGSIPQGGSIADYLGWAREVAGVTRAWVTPCGAGAGTVYVYVMLDIAESGSGGFPVGSDGVATSETRASAATGDQLAVANHIFPLQPVTALVYAKAPLNHAVDVTVTGLSGLSSAAKAAIRAAIGAAIVRTAAVAGSYNAHGTLNTGTIDVSDIEAAILSLAAGTPFLVTLPTTNVTPSAGYLCTPGTITI
jgi:uncharacterized phage protein gp47/JayE